MADQTFTYSFDVLGIPGDAARLEAAVAAQISRQMGIDASQLKVTAQYASAYAAGVIGPTPPLTMATDVPPLPEPPPKPTQADKDARWLRETLERAGDKKASTNPFAGFQMDKTQSEAEAEIAAALQARIDGEAMYQNGNPFRPDSPPAQIAIPEHLRPRRMRTPEEIAEAKAAGAPFVRPSPVALWLEPDAARARAEAREKAAEEQRLRQTMSPMSFAAAAAFADSLGIAVTKLMASFNRIIDPAIIDPAIESMIAIFRSDPCVWDVPAAPAEPPTPGSGLKALRKATNRKAHWLK